MAIALYGFPSGTNTVLRLDNPSLVEDEGSAIPTPFFTTGDIDLGPAGGEGRLRRIVQALTLGGDATVVVTPVANGSEVSSQADTFALLAANGPEQRVESFPASMATRHAMKLEVTAFDGAVSVGEADLFVIPRRSIESA